MIRHACPEDIPAIVELGSRMHQESKYAASPFCPEKCATLAADLIRSEAGCLLACETNGKIIGFLAGGTGEQWFSQQRIAFEYALYIAPLHRGGSGGARLIKAFIQWAEKQGAAVITMGITTRIHQARTAEFYLKMGFEEDGLLFSREIK